MSNSSLTQTTKRRAGAPPRAASRQSETTFFVVLLFIGIHTGVALTYNGQLVVPYFVSFLSALAILSINIRRVSDAVVSWFIFLSIFVFAHALLVGGQSGGTGGFLKSASLMIYCVVIGYGVFVGFSEMGRDRVGKVFFWFSIMLTVGTALEVYGPLKPVSDWFRETMNPWRSIYSNAIRDDLQYGGIRPNFFASEPSLLGSTTGIALFIWLTAKRKFLPQDLAGGGVLILVGFFLIRSPTVLFAPMATFLLRLAVWKPANGIERTFKVAVFIGFFLVVVLLPSVFLYAILEMGDVPGYLRTGSFFERQIAPFLMAAGAMTRSPLIGIGLGSDVPTRNQLALEAFASAGMLKYGLAARSAMGGAVGHLVGNIFWEWWFTFGLLGGAVLAGFVTGLMGRLRTGVPGILVLLIVGGTFWQGFGGVNNPQPWVTLFVAAALARFLTAPRDSHPRAMDGQTLG